MAECRMTKPDKREILVGRCAAAILKMALAKPNEAYFSAFEREIRKLPGLKGADATVINEALKFIVDEGLAEKREGSDRPNPTSIKHYIPTARASLLAALSL